jgi:hypothetical protein
MRFLGVASESFEEIGRIARSKGWGPVVVLHDEGMLHDDDGDGEFNTRYRLI